MASSGPDFPVMPNLTADQALTRLRDGNAAFVRNVQEGQSFDLLTRACDLGQPQRPCAIILGCSDARVPAELVFQQGLGDLFVIRVAGHVVAPSQIGSVEFAVAQYGVRLVVVLGHTSCGAVQATLDSLREPRQDTTANLRSIVTRIQPAIAGLLSLSPLPDDATLMRAAVRANVWAAVGHLRTGSQLLETLIDDDLRVVGAEYDLETGTVIFLDDPLA
ncbi:MAG: carbonic anhydrase [Oceanococcaceae bacterium]